MATKEIITISSDEESGCDNRSELIENKPSHESLIKIVKTTSTKGRSNNSVLAVKNAKNSNSSKPMQANKKKICIEIYHKPTITAQSKKDDIIIIDDSSNKKNINIDKTPEVVDLEECNNVTDTAISNNMKPNIRVSPEETHPEDKIIQPNGSDVATEEQGLEIGQCKQSNSYDHVIPLREKENENGPIVKTDDGESEIPDFFNKFIEHCSSFEKNKNDRARLIKKLEKRCHESDPKYVKSDKFRQLVNESKEKINKNNLYLIAKEVTDELSLRKRIEIKKTQSSEAVTNEKRQVISGEEKKNKKKTKMIDKIIRKLDKLGTKIRELEEAEVDLSDEEDSSYILVQRYRERFCQIYKKLCEVRNEPSDANRVFCRKICFSGTKYPAINQCIEKWLNKTKRFPDFNDIVKLLESQSSSLGLPSNKESIRATATEIFQEVGKMLQRRRKHDLWDSLCGFLNEDKDPALTDPDLDAVLKENFETRVKKEQEIFRHYAELQEKERLEPEEVPEEEANLSPNESGNEDEEEIEGIEKSLNKRLDVTIEKEHDLKESDYNWDGGDKSVTEEVESLPQSNNLSMSVKEAETPTHVKESKNNYKNCKSIKYRGENRSRPNNDISSSKNDSEETNDYDSNDKTVETKEAEKREDISPEGDENSDFDIVSVESNETNSSKLDKFDFTRIPVIKLTRLPDDLNLSNIKVSDNVWVSPKSDKREMKFEDDTASSLKKRKTESEVLELDFRNDVEEVFEVHRCEIEHDFVDDIFNFQDDLTEKRKHWDKGKVFKDLTNVGRLMNGRKRKSPGYFSHSIYHPSFPDFAKFSWKKRFRLNYKFVGLKDQKCALSHDDKDSKSVGGDGKDSDGKGVENNSESGGDDGSNFFIGGGSGSEKDNDENDENKGGEKTKDFSDDSKHDEDEEDEEETEDEMGGIDGKKPEEETPVDDTNCSSDDHTASFNELNTTLELIPDKTTTDKEEGEMEEAEDNNESYTKTKSDGNCENFEENRGGEFEGNIFSGNEPKSSTNSGENGSVGSNEESPESEEPEIQRNADNVDGQIEECNKVGQTEERINDVEEGSEIEEQQDNEDEFQVEVRGEHGKDLDEGSPEKQNEKDSAEIEMKKKNDEDAETGGQQGTDVNVNSKEEEKEENPGTGEVQVKKDEMKMSEKKDEGNKSSAFIKQKEVQTSEKEKPLIRLRSLAEMEARVESRIDPIMVQRIEPRIDPIMRLESRFGLIMEPRIDQRIEPRREQRLEPRIEQRLEPRIEQRIEPRIEQRLEPRMEQRLEPRMEQRLEPRMEQRLEPRMEQRLEQRAGLIIDPRGGLRLEPRAGLRLEPRAGLRLDPRGGLRLEPRTGPRMEPRIGMRIEPRAGLRVEPRGDIRAGLGVELRAGMVVEPRAELRTGMAVEPRAEIRTGMAVEPRAEIRTGMVVEPRAELRTGMVVEPRAELRTGMGMELRGGMGVELRAPMGAEPRAEPRAGMGMEQRVDPRADTRIEPRFERSPLGCKNKRENVVKREISQVNQGTPINQTIQATPIIQTIQRKLSARDESSDQGGQDSDIEFLGQKMGRRKKTTRSPTDEERVKKFLMHSPSSISIIPPKKLSLSKPPSQAALQALETLKGLKGISATRVRSKESKPEDDVVVIGESYPRPQTARKSTSGFKRRNGLPVISSVHSIQSPPATGSTKIQGLQGNVSGLQGSTQPTTMAAAIAAVAANNRIKNELPAQPNTNESSSIRISSVWGSMPQTAVYCRNMPASGNSEPSLPGCSFQNNSYSSSGGVGGVVEGGPTTKKKKKAVEFVVLE